VPARRISWISPNTVALSAATCDIHVSPSYRSCAGACAPCGRLWQPCRASPMLRPVSSPLLMPGDRARLTARGRHLGGANPATEPREDPRTAARSS
jgi:hypothetical protein